MRITATAIVGLSLILPMDAAAGQAGPGTPEEQYATLMKEYRLPSLGIRGAETDQQRKAAVERMGAFAPKFVDLAESAPQDPIALDALRQAIQVVGSTDSGALIAREWNHADFPAGSATQTAGRIVSLVLRDHLQSDKLGPIIDRMRYAYRLEFQECLSTLLKENPHHEVQALACLALAQNLNDRLQMLQLAADRPELVEAYATVFGTDYLPQLQRLGHSALAARIERLFERAAGEFADVEFRTGTIGETAKSELYALRNLSVGRVAPEIKGPDQDGRTFTLSDYRGKVVLLYFWMEF